MALHRTRAIVLKSINLSDSDRLVTFLTEKYGKVNGTPIKKQELKFQMGKSSWKGAAHGKLLQFPLTTNYAQTAHKMQVSSIIYLF